MGFFLLVGLGMYGQEQSSLDSLEIVYNKGGLNVQDKLKILKQITENTNDPDKKLGYSDALIQAATLADSNRYIFVGYLQRGHALRFKSDLDNALKSYFYAAKIAPRKVALGGTYIAIADVYSIIKNHNNAVEYYQKAIEIMKEAKDSVNMANAMHNLGDHYINSNKMDSAIKYTKAAQIIFNIKKNAIGEAYCLGNLGKIYAETGNTPQAERNLDSAIGLLQDLNNYPAICVFLNAISDICLEKGDIKAAENHALKNLKLAQQYGLTEQVSEASLMLSEIYEKAGKPLKALTYYRESIKYRDSVNNVATVQKMADLRTDFEVSEKQKEVNLLATRNKLRIAERNGFIYASVLLALLFATGVYFYRQNVRRNKIIAAQKQELDHLNAAKDKLFSIVSHDLRSSVNALKSGSAKLTQHLTTNNTAELEKLVQQNSAVAHSTYNLLDNLLNWALLQTGQAYFKQEPLNLYLIVEHTAFNYKPLMLEKNIGFENRVTKNVSVYADQESLKIILRNLLDNAIKFSPPNGAITVYDRPSTGNYCEWVVEDTGPGMPAATRQHLANESLLPAKKANEEQVGTGLGLQLCKSFISKNGGKLAIESGEITGTRVVIYLPKTQPDG
jgi:signal transduction histidine kinase